MGVICYVLLCGYPPFYDEDQRKLFKKIRDGKYEFHDEYWSSVSAGAKDLISKMLTVNQRERWSATQLLSHYWITAGDTELATHDLSGSIVQMKKFNARKRFRAAGNAVIMANRMQNLITGMNLTRDQERMLGHMGTSFSGVRVALYDPEIAATSFDLSADTNLATIQESPSKESGEPASDAGQSLF